MKKNTYFSIVIAACCIIASNCIAQSQGPNYPDTVINNTYTGVKPWTNPLNAKDSDKIYATDSLVAGSLSSNCLEDTGFNFSIPATATITGITAEVLGHANNHFAFGPTNIVQLVKNGVIQGPSIQGTGLTLADAWQTFGGCSNLWSNTWAYSDINAPGFGVIYYGYVTSFLGPNGYYDIFIDALRLTVCYTIPTSAETFSQTSVSNCIYPNPSHGTVALNYPGKYMAEVYDLTGKEVYKSTLQGAADIDLSNLSTGMYFMHITSGSYNITKKIVIEK